MNHAPHPYSLRQLQYAVAIADTGGFRRAAEACHVSQPALSAQLASLEEALGTPLFERGARGVLLTGAGEALVAQARKILAEADNLVALAQRLGDPLASTLRIGIIPTLSPYLVPELVGPLRAAFPALQIFWVEDRTPRLRAQLATGEIDAAIVAVESELGDVHHESLGRDPFLLALYKEHPLAASTGELAVDDVGDATILVLEDGHCLRDQTLRLCAHSVGVDFGVRATSLSTLAQMVASGLGLTFLPQIAVATENRQGRLVVRRLSPPSPFRTVALAWRSHSPIANSFHTLATTMRKGLAGVLEPDDSHDSRGSSLA